MLVKKIFQVIGYGTLVAITACATTQDISQTSERGVPVSKATKMETKQASQDKADKEVVNQDGKKLICKSLKKTGTRLGKKKICRTKAEWEFAREESQRNTRGMQDDGLLGQKGQ